MSIGSISLSSAARSNLLALQNTNKLLSQTQERLSSGKKVNSSMDNAAAYFSSKGFLNRANDLSNLKDSISTAVQTLKSATDAIDSISSVVDQMKGLTNAALQTTDTTTLSGLATQFNGLMSQIDGIAADSVFNGTNLLNGTGITLSVYFNATSTTKLDIASINSTSAGLSIATASAGWATQTAVLTSQSLLQTAVATLRTNSSNFGNNNTILSTRLDFTNNLINTLQVASDKLVLADTNEEGANMQALQAQSQLGIVALSISGEQAQAIMRLF